jgi:hypothetical protein
VRVFDLPVAAAGRLGAAIARRGRRAEAAVLLALVTLSLIPVLIVGSTRQPTEISFSDLRANRLPAATSWLRLEGDLRTLSSAGPNTYTLHDLGNDALSVVVLAPAPLATGHTQVTGRLTGTTLVADGFATIEADLPAEPARHDPWLLFSIPVLLALLLLLAIRLGYPVVRRDPPARSRAHPLGSGDRLSARWSGWIGNEQVPLAEMRPCTIEVAPDVDVCLLTITDGGAVRRVSTRRASPKQRLRLCWTGATRPALQVHAPSADLVVSLEAAADRDRLAASLE